MRVGEGLRKWTPEEIEDTQTRLSARLIALVRNGTGERCPGSFNRSTACLAPRPGSNIQRGYQLSSCVPQMNR